MSELRNVLRALKKLDASLEAFYARASNEEAVNSRAVLSNALQSIGARRLNGDGRPARMYTPDEAAAELRVTL